jgi:hypothetical protein
MVFEDLPIGVPTQLPNISYSLEKNKLVFCAADEGQPRPSEFRTEPGQVLRIHQRVG